MKKYLFLLLIISFQVSAESLCERVEKNLTAYLSSSDSRMGFKNRGGLFGGGVCWWHSRFQRSSAYLAEFEPLKEKPSPAQLQNIMNNLKKMDRVVSISGFENFNSFSKAYEKQIQKVLEQWQREDGFINQQWLRGISGKSELEAQEMKQRMDTLHEQFLKSPQPVWIMAQIKGITSHSMLLVDMLPRSNGYELNVIDSNFPMDQKVIEYQVGQSSLKHPKDKYSFVPYLGFQKDFEKLQVGFKRHCGNNFGLKTQIPEGEVEVSR